jgi:hypothetical protein
MLLWSALPGKAATFYPLLTNGPASNRLCLVFLSEGYTNGQATLFLQDCTNALNTYFGGGDYTGEEPFVEYENYFNAYAIFTNSVQTGADHPQYGLSRDTVFNCSYDAVYDYVITNDATGQSRVQALLNTYVPTNQFRFRLPVLLVNDLTSGGSGGATAIVAAGGNLEGILVHETGHVLAGLGDEYEALPTGQGIDSSTYPAEPNTTTNTAFASIPWKAWINTNTTPIPTPGTNSQYIDDVGLFEGAHYSATNWYRPKLNCRMRSVTTGVLFCEVCRETLVKTFYTKVNALDSLWPTNSLVALNPGAPTAFGVTPLQPRTHALALQWLTNGVNVLGATNTAFALPPQPWLTNLSVIVRDATDWVRNDPAKVLAATNTWTLSSLWLESPQALAGGQFRCTVRGSSVTQFTVQGTADLATWTSLATNSLSGGQFQYTNSGLSGVFWRFYRAVSPPQ